MTALWLYLAGVGTGCLSLPALAGYHEARYGKKLIQCRDSTCPCTMTTDPVMIVFGSFLWPIIVAWWVLSAGPRWIGKRYGLYTLAAHQKQKQLAAAVREVETELDALAPAARLAGRETAHLADFR